jgi:hypothetical protein
MKYFIYFEVLILSTLFLIYSLIKLPITALFSYIATIHRTADFYSHHKIHFFEPSKARKVYDEELGKKLRETYGVDNDKR